MASSTLDLRDGRIIVRAPYQLRLALRALGGWWEPELQAWIFPAELSLAHNLSATVAGALTTPAFDALLRTGVPSDARYTRDAPEIPGLLGRSWAHQRRAYADAISRPATMLAIGMGGGKSRIAIGCILNRPDVRRVLVLCPLSVVPVWPAEFAKHTYPCAVLPLAEGSVAEKTARAKQYLEFPRLSETRLVVVINYESARAEPFRTWSLSAGFDMVILDESHRAKRPGGVTSRYVTALGRRAAYRLCLSGTPAAHSPMDLFAQYRFLDPRAFGTTSFVQFRRRYAILGGFEGREVVGYQNVEEFNRRYHSIAFQVGREVLDLPEATDVTRYCELGPEARRVYRDLERRFYAEVEDGTLTIHNALGRVLRLSQVTGGALPLDEGGIRAIDHAKRDLLAEVLEEIGPAEPVVVFCRFRYDLDEVQIAGGDEVRELSGRVNQLAEWQAGEGRILAAQVQAGSVGIDATRAAYCVFYSVGYSLAEWDQARARVHRPGQSRPVTYVRLVARDTIDEVIYTALEQRRDVIETILARRDRDADAL